MTSTASPAPAAGPSRLLIVDDHALVRLGLSTLLGTGGGLDILEARTLEQALALYAAQRDSIALVLLDLHLPDAHGLSGLHEFLRFFPGAPVVVLSSHNDPTLVRQARAAGALAYFNKSDQWDTMLGFVQARCLPRQDEAGATAGANDGGAADDAPEYRFITTVDGERVRLTPRQAQVLDCLLTGQTNREIADSVFLAEGTVKHRVSTLLMLFNVRSRAQLISRLR
jgi:DNA-binding NarL/FixJ family response regulator